MKPLTEEAPAKTAAGVVFTAFLPAQEIKDAAAIAGAVRAWLQQKKAQMMSSFAVLDTYGTQSAYLLRMIVEGPRSFDAHKALGMIGFRLEDGRELVAYRLALACNWNSDDEYGRFEQALQPSVPRRVPPEQCHEVATAFVRRFKECFGQTLDHSPGSLARLNRLFLRREQGGASNVVFLPSTVIAGGCYLGEVLMRSTALDSGWLATEDENGCNFYIGPARLNPCWRILELCVCGSESSLPSSGADLQGVYRRAGLAARGWLP